MILLLDILSANVFIRINKINETYESAVIAWMATRDVLYFLGETKKTKN